MSVPNDMKYNQMINFKFKNIKYKWCKNDPYSPESLSRNRFIQ